jgi:hypothetical protein
MKGEILWTETPAGTRWMISKTETTRMIRRTGTMIRKTKTRTGSASRTGTKTNNGFA